ncbi:MAG TPA: hypothetical protein VHA70_03190 [Bauldia sp.]|nr:hypothetical protein [Bauldia sp.]
MKSVRKPAKKKVETFTAEEKAAMREYAAEKRGRSTGKIDGEAEVRTKIAAMKQPDRGLAERIHALITANAPALKPRTWYGMPAWARDDKIVCFFQPGQKFKTRYSTLGFSDKAMLDDGNMWPTTYAVTQLTAADETRIKALLKKALG